MIPEVHIDALSIGPARVQPFGLLLTLGVIAAHTALVRRARAEGLGRPAVVEGFAIAVGAGGLLTTLVADRIGAGGFSSLAAVGGAIAAGAAYTGLRNLDVLRFADAAAWAFPFGWVFARGGCALVHDHLGPASQSWVAVNFTTGPRLDLGLLEWLCIPLLFLAVLAARRYGRPGAIAGALAVTYPLIRFPLDFLRVSDSHLLGLTPAQWGAFPLLAAGIILLVMAHQGKPKSDHQT